MGLDNIPHNYPCQKQGIASLNKDGRIDCDLTKSKGNCPWKNEYEKEVLLKEARPTYGMLGTDCWYRGKYGNFLLRLLEGNPDSYFDSELNFYGEGIDENTEGMSVDYCLHLSKYMADNTEKFAHQARAYCNEENGGNEKDLINDWIYATWWLKFAAEHCDGSSIWY